VSGQIVGLSGSLLIHTLGPVAPPQALGTRSHRPCCTDRSLGGEDWTVYQGPVPDPGPPPCHSKPTKIAAITSRSSSTERAREIIDGKGVEHFSVIATRSSMIYDSYRQSCVASVLAPQ
jgi:hypothetical protein